MGWLETQSQTYGLNYIGEVDSKEKSEDTWQHILIKSITLSKHLLKIYVVLSYQIVFRLK